MNSTQEITHQEIRELAINALDNKIEALHKQRAQLSKLLPPSKAPAIHQIVFTGSQRREDQTTSRITRKPMSEEHREKLKIAARKRWAKARKAKK